ncbi:UNVERIFIED_CONTAM: hypothetical protein K2H54_000877 [Gekko kuhli]
MFRPLYDRMESVEKTIKETQQMAEGDYQNSLANHVEIKQIQQAEEILAERTLKLDLSIRQNNLKLRGKQYKISDKDEGLQILSTLNAEAPMDFTRQSSKHPHSDTPPPPSDSD